MGRGGGGLRRRAHVAPRPDVPPRLPPHIARLRFRLLVRGQRLRVDIRHSEVTYEVVDGEPFELFHDDERVLVEAGKPETRPWTAPDAGPEPVQPRPAAHRRGGGGSGVARVALPCGALELQLAGGPEAVSLHRPGVSVVWRHQVDTVDSAPLVAPFIAVVRPAPTRRGRR